MIRSLLTSPKWICVVLFTGWSIYSLQGIVNLVKIPTSLGSTDTSLSNAIQPGQPIDLHFYLSKHEVTNSDFQSISLHKDPLLPTQDRFIPLFGEQAGICGPPLATTGLTHVLSLRAHYNHPYVTLQSASEKNATTIDFVSSFFPKIRRDKLPLMDETSILQCDHLRPGKKRTKLIPTDEAGAVPIRIPRHLENQKVYLTTLSTRVHRGSPPNSFHDVYAMPPDSARLTLQLTPPALTRPLRLLLRDRDGSAQRSAMKAFLKRGGWTESLSGLAKRKWLSVPRYIDVSTVVHHGLISKRALIARGLGGLVSPHPVRLVAAPSSPPTEVWSCIFKSGVSGEAKEAYTLPLSANTLSSPRDEFVPLEVGQLVRIAEGEYGDIAWSDDQAMNASVTPAIKYKPKTLKGWLLQHIMVESLNVAERKYGIPAYDIDSLKVMMGGGNATLIISTMTISLLHIVFSLLSFSSDFSFWTSNAIGAARGISLEIVLAMLIALYLWDTGHAFIVLALLAAKIVLYAFKLVQINRFRKQLTTPNKEAEDLDRYERLWVPRLALVLGPFVLGVCMYRLVFIPQASWPSWIIESLAICSYAGGFIAMTPQLFRNYKLQSVDHLPWATLTYQALNAFVDDFFAFIIRMPQIHRYSVFRDDLIFIIYLYQYFLYRKGSALEDEAESKKDK